MKKRCSGCLRKKGRSKFSANSRRKDGLNPLCVKCSKEPRKTKVNKIKQIFYTQNRTSKKRGYCAPAYTKEELIVWCMGQSIYHKLHKAWRKDGYKTELAPSCDRIDDYKPYTLDNIQLMTWEENNNKYRKDKRAGRNNKHNKRVHRYNKSMTKKKTYHSISEASRDTKIATSNICKCCKGEYQTAGGYVWRYAARIMC